MNSRQADILKAGRRRSNDGSGDASLGLKKEVASQEDSERLELMDGLERTRVQMQQAYLQFDTVEDPDLIESSVFEIKSLQPGIPTCCAG